MSTDFNVCCRKCNRYVHLGQRFTSGYSFGYGSNDQEGAARAMEFINLHYNCGSLTILLTDSLPDDMIEEDKTKPLSNPEELI